MTKFFRRSSWFLSSFVSKYYRQIASGVVIAITLTFFLNYLGRYMPQTKTNTRLALVGQFTTSQLPLLINQYLAAGLVQFDSNLQIVPQLASSWTLENDNKTYSFVLKDNLKWSDSTPVKVTDIHLSIPNVQVETVEPNIVKFHLPAKYSPFPSILTFPITSKRNLLISPYQIKVRQKSSGLITQIVLESNQTEKTFKIYPSAQQAFTAYKLGEVDGVVNYNVYSHAEETQVALNKYGYTNQIPNYHQIVLLYFNYQDPLLKSKSLRQAIAYGLADKSFGFTRSLTTINPQSWAYNPLVKTYDYDQNKAKELIKNNTPTGQKLELELATLPELLPIAESIKNQLEPLGVNIKTQVTTTNNPETFQLLLSTFNSPNDPDQYANWHSTQEGNLGHQNDEKIDKALEEGRTTFNQAERRKQYLEFQRVFTEELPALPLFHPNNLNLARNKAISAIINQEFAP